eukprot:15485855-Alexandrium_andersonii.AAC.1
MGTRNKRRWGTPLLRSPSTRERPNWPKHPPEMRACQLCAAVLRTGLAYAPRNCATPRLRFAPLVRAARA